MSAQLSQHVGRPEQAVFIIPVRIDSPDRAENLGVAISYLRRALPQSRVLIVESDRDPKVPSAIRNIPGVDYDFLRNEGRFNKSLAINRAISLSHEDYVIVYDCDVLIAREAILESVEILAKGWFSVVIPHNGIFLNIRGLLRRRLATEQDPALISLHSSTAPSPQGADIQPIAIPGAVFCASRSAVVEAGGFNHLMVSYGWEDVEIFKRMSKLGFARRMLGSFNVLHLDHARGQDSKPNELFEVNHKICQRVESMSLAALCRYVSNELGAASRSHRVLFSRSVQRRIKNAVTGVSLVEFFDRARFAFRRSAVGRLILGTKGRADPT